MGILSHLGKSHIWDPYMKLRFQSPRRFAPTFDLNFNCCTYIDYLLDFSPKLSILIGYKQTNIQTDKAKSNRSIRNS